MMKKTVRIIFLLFNLGISFSVSSQELGFNIGINKVSYHPFYRTFSEQYHLTLQTDLLWKINKSNKNHLLIGGFLQVNAQEVLGKQVNIGPILRYRRDFFKKISGEIQLGYGTQFLFPSRTLYEQSDDGSWSKASQVEVNHALPILIGIVRYWGRHSINLSYWYQFVLGINSSIKLLPVDGWLFGYRFRLRKE